MANNDSMLHAIDGSELEGGGQILRVSLSIACLLSKSISISKIRALRSKPGLAAQHLASARLVKDISGADSSLIGAELGSTELIFHRGNRLASDSSSSYRADCGTAGSITLMIQSSLPCLGLTSSAFRHQHLQVDNISTRDITLKLIGGTNVSASPPIDHFKHVLLPLLQRHCGVKATITIEQRGYYPRGGGSVQLSITPVEAITSFALREQGSLIDLCAVVYGNADATLLRELEHNLCEEFQTKPLVAKDGSQVSQITLYDSDTSEEILIPVEGLGSTKTRGGEGEGGLKYVSLSSHQQQEKIRNHQRGSNNNDDRHSSSSSSQQKQQQQQRHNSHGNASRSYRQKVVSGIGCQLFAHTTSGAILSANTFIDTKTHGGDLTETTVKHLAANVSSELRALALTGACVDEYTADQLVLYMALAGNHPYNDSSLLVEPANANSSLHIATAIKISSDLSGAQFTFDQELAEEVDFEEKVGGHRARNRLLRCTGIGFTE